MARDVAGYLAEQQRKSTGDVAQEWGTLEEFYNKKLWHQLTLRLGQFVKTPLFAQGDGLLKLYQNFIADFEHRINPVSLVEIVMYVLKTIKDPKEALDFLEKIQEKVNGTDEATIMCLTAVANIKLKAKEMESTKEVIKQASVLLEAMDGVTQVHGPFYDMCSNYHKLMGNHAEYYRDALRYLGCTDMKNVSTAEQVERAFNIGLAAVLGKGVYNFGELLAHPVLIALASTERKWLVELLYAFNSGNISRFDELKPQWAKQPDLAQHEIAMRQKISLLCLMEMTFKRPATNRLLSFEEIATEAHLPFIEVEMLVMKALSLDLVKGSIDQVDQKVHMTWVQPRVLDKDQIGTMQKKLEVWCKDVRDMEKLVENKAHDILT